MKKVNLIQGSPEWLAFRRDHNTASEASAMMGASSHTTRNDLLRLKATGDEQAIYQGLADKGHAAEAAGRAIAERIIGDELYPVTGYDEATGLSASFDGIRMRGDIIWENKQFNADKIARVRAGELPIEDKWQVVQQLLISRAARCLYMVTDGTEEGTAHMWVTLDQADAKALLDGWALFDQDRANYKGAPLTAPVVGSAPESLPALSVQIQGRVLASNLDVFKAKASEVLAKINTDLKTDEDFANADATTKWCKEAEERIAGTKQNILGQTATIDEAFRLMDEVSAMIRNKRLDLEKQVKTRKDGIRDEILQDGQSRYRAHMQTLNEGLPLSVLTPANSPTPDFASVMKGKKTIKSLRDAVDQELARVKLEANALAERIRSNFKLLGDHQVGFETLFHDRAHLVFKAAEDMVAVVKARIAEHKDAEAKRQLQTAAPPTPVPSTAALSAPAPLPAAAPVATAGPTLEKDLAAWQKKHKVTGAAFATLQALLIKHKVLPAEAA